MKATASVALALMIVGAIFVAEDYQLNVWLFALFALIGFISGLVMILVPLPPVLFTVSLSFAGATVLVASNSSAVLSIVGGVLLALILLSIFYLVWLREKADEQLD